MAQLDSLSSCFVPIRSTAIAFTLGAIFAAAPAAQAQAENEPTVEGYITAVGSPNDFSVNGQRVVTTDETDYGIRNGTAITRATDLRQKMQVGAYVYVVGEIERKTRAVKARSVYLRDELDKKLAGLGVIQRVIARGTDTVVEADGYRIRITPATHTEFRDPSLTLSNVDVNTWVRYQGRRNAAGDMVASSVLFMPGKLSQQRSVFKLEENVVPFRPAGSTRKNAAELAQGGGQVWGGEVKLGNHWYGIPKDAALQKRVERVGLSLVPEYQKEMPANHPSKIPFRFYAVDDEKVRTEVCATDGLILVSKQMVDRLRSDDQLAAVLADGVAYNLQRQAAKLAKDNRIINGAEFAFSIASLLPVAGLTFAVAYLATGSGTTAGARKIEIAQEEQRGRVALALMADAGYDPHQAPEAWRLLEPKHLPANPQSLKYPRLSGYELGILNLQYNAEQAAGPEKTITEATISHAQ